jgi:asparagine synthetase B (glutamine-hydrolysing)
MADSISSGRSVQYFIDDRIIVAGVYRYESNIASGVGDVCAAVAGNLFFQGETLGGAPALANAWTRWGEDFVKYTGDLFTCLIYDLKSRKCIVSNDIIGAIPFFYTKLDGALYFATQLRPFLLCDAFPKVIDKHALDLYFAYGCIPGLGAILSGVWKLKPSTLSRILPTGVFGKRYWQIGDASVDRKKSFGDWVDLLYETLRRSLHKRAIRYPGPLGVMLGGSDSCIVASLLRRVSDGEIHAFTATYEDSSFNEPYSRDVADSLEMERHDVLVKADEIPEVVIELAKIYDEPVGDMVASPLSYVVVKQTRNKVSTLFDGNGAEELFGWPRPRVTLRQRYFDTMHSPVRSGISYGPRLLANRLRFRGRPLGFILDATRAPLERMIDLWRVVNDENLQNLLPPNRKATATDLRTPLKDIVDTSAAIEQLSRQDLGCALEIAFQPAHGFLQNRVRSISWELQQGFSSPYLDRELVGVAYSMPWQIRTPTPSRAKYVLQAMAVSKQLLPREVAFQQKRGLGSSSTLTHTQMGDWLTGKLSTWTRDTILELLPSVRHLLDGDGILKLLRVGKSQQIFEVLNFVLWHDYYFPS